jgi:hypothetical protein
MTLSGSVLNLNIPNPTFPAELIGIFGQDEGINQGTGTILNVTGEASLTRSGTVLNLNVPLPTFPTELIGIYGQNEGVGLGTGTILNVFGGGATLGLSGSTLGLDLTEAAKFGFSVLMGDGSGTFPVGLQVSPIEVPFGGILTSWTLLADVTGSITVNVWKDTYNNFPPTSADLIFSPSLTNQRKNTAIITGTVSEGDIIQLYLGPATSIKQLTLSLKGRKS